MTVSNLFSVYLFLFVSCIQIQVKVMVSVFLPIECFQITSLLIDCFQYGDLSGWKKDFQKASTLGNVEKSCFINILSFLEQSTILNLFYASYINKQSQLENIVFVQRSANKLQIGIIIIINFLSLVVMVNLPSKTI